MHWQLQCLWKVDTMARLHSVLTFIFYICCHTYWSQYSFLQKDNRKTKGKNSAFWCPSLWWLGLGRSMCPCSLYLSLQLCCTQMAPVCSVGLIITLASSEIAWIQNLIHVSSVIMALISEVSVSIPEDTLFLHMFIHLISDQIKCKNNISLWYDSGTCNTWVLVCGCHFANN